MSMFDDYSRYVHGLEAEGYREIHATGAEAHKALRAGRPVELARFKLDNSEHIAMRPAGGSTDVLVQETTFFEGRLLTVWTRFRKPRV